MIISMVVAASENNVIGKNNELLWSLPNDTRFFKNTTWAMPVIMGSKTFASLKNVPLNGRFNIVVTRHPESIQATSGTVRTAGSLQEAVKTAEEAHVKEVFVIGGGQIYREAMPVANKIVLTRVHTTIEGDTLFPAIDEKEWRLSSRIDLPADEKHKYAYSFEVWLRK
ncbi:MAG: dihydrofolate reductase [Bacteroidetes bacterium]|nr:dihydrofolate reductase [Bacteroidota bacterium]